jgi:hypothetical protein
VTELVCNIDTDLSGEISWRHQKDAFETAHIKNTKKLG